MSIVQKKHPTRKSRPRPWQAGLNDTKTKRYFRKRVRIMIKKGHDDLAKGNTSRKINNTWDINDFKH
jgi:hypothetical protein